MRSARGPQRRFERAPDTVHEVLPSLPGDPGLAERAFAEDTRLRSLADAFDSYMGVAPEDRVRAFEESDGEPRDPTGLLRL